MAAKRKETAIPVICVREGGDPHPDLSVADQAWAKANNFSGQQGRLLPLPGDNGVRRGFLFGMGDPETAPALVTGLAAQALEPGTYSLVGDISDPDMAALGFKLGAYRFDRYKDDAGAVTLAMGGNVNGAEVERLVQAASIARDLVNTPANDLGPDAFETEIRAFAKARKMTVKVTAGDQLLKDNFPMIHAVGRASAQAPRLLDLSWGHKSHPKVTLVGKGVTFDTGGLDIKPPSNMVLMKKDMGGAANVLGLAHAIVDAGLKVRLRVLLPVVENSISGNSFRPSDVLRARNGLSVEIGNTDAEGRLILADALALADEETPDLLIDMATLTGAARVALGPDLPAMFTSDDGLAADLMAGAAMDDPVWRMPLWQPYARMLASRIADINHIGQSPMGGATLAALFLNRFVKNAKAWVHLDIFAWSPEARAGRPYGGTDHGIRAVYLALKKTYS